MPEFTAAERIMLANQYRILAHLEGKTDAYDLELQSLRSGYDEDFGDLVGHSDEPTISAENRKLVRNILWLYYLMKLAVNHESIEAKTIEVDETGRRKFENLEPKFPGFDGNGETGCYGYAQFLIHGRGHFPEHHHYLNSHGAEPDYAAMLRLHHKWGNPADLTKEQVAELLALR